MAIQLEPDPLKLSNGFVDAVVQCDLTALADLVAPDVRVRALLPGGLREIDGVDALVERVDAWFGDGEQVDVVSSGTDEVGHKRHVWWRLQLHKPEWGVGARRVVEQQAYLVVDDGRITRIDLVCTGFLDEGAGGTDG